MGDNDNLTLLMYASMFGCKKIVQYLIENGCDVNIKNNFGKNALIIALYEGNYGVCKILIDNGT